MIKQIFYLSFLLLTPSFAAAQKVKSKSMKTETIEELVMEIAKNNVFCSILTSQFERFELLKQKASKPELVRLTKDSNAVVACYAGFALIDLQYEDLASIYGYFATHSKMIRVLLGCNSGYSDSGTLFYDYYIKNSDFQPHSTHIVDTKTLFLLDSINIFVMNGGEKSFKNSLFPTHFLKRIEFLAFEEEREDALEYLSRWYEQRYKSKIDRTMRKIDSLAFVKNDTFLRIENALQKRVVPEVFRSKIEYWAFEKKNKSALRYLSKHYKAEYAPRIKAILLNELNSTTFKSNTIEEYYELISDLLAFDDFETKTAIKNKLKKDRSWKKQSKRFFILVDAENDFFFQDLYFLK